MNNTPLASKKPVKGPNCWDCRYLAITWDVRLPYGCQYMGFRSRVLPSLEVIRTDGRHCGAFAPKLSSAEKAVKKPIDSAANQDVGKTTNRRNNDKQIPKKRINIRV